MKIQRPPRKEFVEYLASENPQDMGIISHVGLTREKACEICELLLREGEWMIEVGQRREKFLAWLLDKKTNEIVWVTPPIFDSRNQAKNYLEEYTSWIQKVYLTNWVASGCPRP
ncbi:MAG: hypothetical protein G01um101417_46 [Parcubacteria group bacterium Gr01-1014_17]|nr:MAG: hypothetical protein G01um101417_46 [Parcubacteria group bacterium Gr01-1014_17]